MRSHDTVLFTVQQPVLVCVSKPWVGAQQGWRIRVNLPVDQESDLIFTQVPQPIIIQVASDPHGGKANHTVGGRPSQRRGERILRVQSIQRFKAVRHPVTVGISIKWISRVSPQRRNRIEPRIKGKWMCPKLRIANEELLQVGETIAVTIEVRIKRVQRIQLALQSKD